MKTTKAVITAAARNQRTLPLQTLVDRDGVTKSILSILVEEALRAGMEAICVVVCPGDETAYREAAGDHAGRLHFVPQAEPLGYGHAVYCAREFVGAEPFLHMIGDHIYISDSEKGCAQQLVEVAQAQACAVSGVQPTRENLLPYFGAVGGQRVKGTQDLYEIERVFEKPTPTEAEQSLMIPGLRAGHYLCFFGMHLFTPAVMELLAQHVARNQGQGGIALSPVLAELAARERYLALEAKGRRYPVDVRYGLLTAQLALGLSGQDRDEVLTALCELLAQREPRMAEER
ncbi:MAG TPA: sugar phosphate nucleotidyltransferase [Chthonomonadaceae bacterium]|nr:sugar phosphate nucleotidyltransferase [Chthonomonadaceae bacterium]